MVRRGGLETERRGLWRNLTRVVRSAVLSSPAPLSLNTIRYVVSPKDQARLERVAADHFPELRKSCPAFMRHKEILLSPSLLRAHGIPFTQVWTKL